MFSGPNFIQIHTKSARCARNLYKDESDKFRTYANDGRHAAHRGVWPHFGLAVVFVITVYIGPYRDLDREIALEPLMLHIKGGGSTRDFGPASLSGTLAGLREMLRWWNFQAGWNLP